MSLYIGLITPSLQKFGDGEISGQRTNAEALVGISIGVSCPVQSGIQLIHIFVDGSYAELQLVKKPSGQLIVTTEQFILYSFDSIFLLKNKK